ncbi:MAG: hypothetical protein EPO26_16965 [Chloroflexota bacterium]|nr:MAG: hypothetical protein EPO26_16965 [Chloroflexota bacterium]
MTVAGLLVRALVVVLLLGAFALPLADHHAGSRLPEAGFLGPSVDVRLITIHHHGGDGEQASQPAGPAFLPGVLSSLVGAPMLALGLAGSIRLTVVERDEVAPSRILRTPLSAHRAPPTPPPLFAL